MSHENWRNASKSPFLYYYNQWPYCYNGAQKHEGFVGFEKAYSKTKTRHPNVTELHSFLYRLLPRMRICKEQKPCVNSTWIARLIHGFLPVKTWLLIACDTAFYAIMHVITYRYEICRSQTRRHVINTSYSILCVSGQILLYPWRLLCKQWVSWLSKGFFGNSPSG